MARYKDATVGLFSNIDDANAAIDGLHEAGISTDAISVVAQQEIIQNINEDVASEDLSDGAGTGAAIGGVLGLLAGIGAIAIPGVGPVLSAGTLAAALGSTAVGAGLGGLVGALVDLGIPDSEAQAYSESVGRGEILVTVAGSGVDHDKVQSIFENNNAHDVTTQSTQA